MGFRKDTGCGFFWKGGRKPAREMVAEKGSLGRSEESGQEITWPAIHRALEE